MGIRDGEFSDTIVLLLGRSKTKQLSFKQSTCASVFLEGLLSLSTTSILINDKQRTIRIRGVSFSWWRRAKFHLTNRWLKKHITSKLFFFFWSKIKSADAEMFRVYSREIRWKIILRVVLLLRWQCKMICQFVQKQFELFVHEFSSEVLHLVKRDKVWATLSIENYFVVSSHWVESSNSYRHFLHRMYTSSISVLAILLVSSILPEKKKQISMNSKKIQRSTRKEYSWQKGHWINRWNWLSER